VAEIVMPDGRVMDIKFKYTCPKSRGTYKGGGGQNAPRAKRKKTGGGSSDIEWVKVVTSTGATRWDQRPRQKR
jgi:hypothetical protein